MVNYIEDSDSYMVIPISFETGEQIDHVITLSHPIEVIGAQSLVSKALAATNAGTITIKNASGGSTITTISHPASAAINTSVTGSITAANAYCSSQIEIISAKTTAGGKSTLFLYYRKVSEAGATP